jgi:hypothetical protein
MYSQDHAPPHFHAKYGGHDVAMTIEDLEIANGAISPRARRLVRQWASLHRAELREAWNRIRRHEIPDKIDPLP